MAERIVKDARVRRTRRRLREALVSLIHEKSYPAIVVDEILERADVGRSAFYAHFQNKDALLTSGIDEMLHETPPRIPSSTVGRFDKALSFSFPAFDYIWRHRHAADSKMERTGWMIVHQHLQRALVDRIRGDVEAANRSAERRDSVIPTDLVTGYIVTTFILVLNWWVQSRSALSAREVDDLFLALVAPALKSLHVGGPHDGPLRR